LIAAGSSKWFKRVFAHYNENYLLRRHFQAFQLSGEIDPALQGQPVLYVMNHSSWWDGMVVYHVIANASKREHYMMMDEEQMKRYRFFRKIGAFSIDKKSSRAIVASLHYSESLLNQGHGVWLFPQGDIEHLERRPLRFQTGAGYLLERCPETIVQPVTAYYSLGLHQKAEVSLLFGEPMHRAWQQLGRKTITTMLESTLEDQLNQHRNAVISAARGELAEYRSMLKAKRSTNEVFDAWMNGVTRWKSFFGR